MRNPREMGAGDVQDFLSMLANGRQVSASTHNQALSALLFLDREVLGGEVPNALAVNYPNLGRRWGWFWVFPAPRLSLDPRSGIERRASPGWGAPAARHQAGQRGGTHRQACVRAHPAPFLAHASAAGRH